MIRTSVILDTLYCAVEGICITMLIVGSMIFVVLCLLQILENLYLQSGRLNRIYAWLGRLRIRAFQAVQNVQKLITKSVTLHIMYT